MQHVKPYVKQLCYLTANHICVLYCCCNRAFGIKNKLALSYQGKTVTERCSWFFFLFAILYLRENELSKPPWHALLRWSAALCVVGRGGGGKGKKSARGRRMIGMGKAANRNKRHFLERSFDQLDVKIRISSKASLNRPLKVPSTHMELIS